MRREARMTTFFIDGGSSDSAGAGLGEESIFWRFLSKKRMTVFLAVCADETTHKTHLPNAQKVRRNIPNRDKAYFDMHCIHVGTYEDVHRNLRPSCFLVVRLCPTLIMVSSAILLGHLCLGGHYS